MYLVDKLTDYLVVIIIPLYIPLVKFLVLAIVYLDYCLNSC